MAATAPKSIALERIDSAYDDLIALSHEIHAHPEVAFEEVKSSGWVAGRLSDAGMAVTEGVADLPTAFVAVAGSGPLVMGICAEYDALPGVGHACGHNVISAAAVGAALSLVPLVDELGITLKVFGTPAEERGGGKILMLRKGVFDGTHAAMMIHPASYESALVNCRAVSHHQVRYQGRESHASMHPEHGVNAADALVVAQVAIGLLRQQLRPGDQVHGVVTDGGDAPNIIPGHAGASYYIRATSLTALEELFPRVRSCFEAGALATGAQLAMETVSPIYSEFRIDPGLNASYRRNAGELGREFGDETGETPSLSTDMGNVSLALPSIHPIMSIDSLPAVNHQAEFTAAAARPAADRAVRDGAAGMAWTIIDTATSSSERERLIALAAGRAAPSASS